MKHYPSVYDHRRCREIFAVSDLIDEVTSTVQPMVANNSNTLKVTIADDIGMMHSDLTKIRQSLLNLLSNVCKFTERGALWLQADRETVDRRDWITLRIRDTGIGMAPEQMEKLFKEVRTSGHLEHPKVWWDRAGTGDYSTLLPDARRRRCR